MLEASSHTLDTFPEKERFAIDILRESQPVTMLFILFIPEREQVLTDDENR